MDVFGGSPQRWCGAYKWFLYYIYNRYYDSVLSIRRLTRLRHQFPKYATKICRKFNQDRYYLENHTFSRIYIESTVSNEDNFTIIAFFLYWSEFETLVPGADPHGDYIHIMRGVKHYLN